MLPTELDLVVASLARPGTQPTAVIKLAATEGATASIEHEAAALMALHADDRLRSWVSILPSIVATGRTDGLAYFVEDFIAGNSARDLAADPGTRPALVTAAAEAVAPLHALTASATTVDAASVDRWVHDPFADLVRLLAGSQSAGREPRCRIVAAQLEADLLGRPVEESWIHGDYWLGNLLVRDGALAGIVDWGQAEQDALPALDMLHLVLTARVLSHDQPFGATVLTALADPEWSEAESVVLRPWTTGPSGSRPSLRTLILLAWLRHVASNARKSYRYRRSELWMGQNVDEVLESIA
jgi:aminoglycoside phosphotransferase (APT) family kinase protein